MQKKKGILKQIADALNPYAWIMEARNRAFDCGRLKSHAFDLPVICVGNITVGGTGKTPHTEYLIRLLKEKEKVAVLSRGYGRKSRGYLKADADSTTSLIGDEPYQIKEKFPEITVAVCEKRVTGVENLLKEKEKPTTIVLDDAFQHRYIKAGLYILLIDINRPIWNDSVMPFGRLREREEGTTRADIIIMTKCPVSITDEQMSNCKAQLKTKAGTPVFFSTVVYGKPYPLLPGTEEIKDLQGAEIMLVAGIANPAPLKKELEARGAKVTLKKFADHHNFTADDIADIASEHAKSGSNRLIITTEKDATRLRQAQLPQSIKENIHIMPIEIKILDNKENMFNQIILDYVTENRRNS